MAKAKLFVRSEKLEIFYAPTCIFSHYFIDQTVNALRAIDPKIDPQKVNMWENPEEAKARGLVDSTIYINGHPLKSPIFERLADLRNAG